MNTDATASAPLTPSREILYARTASLPTLAGRKVPTNVLTKNTSSIRARGGRTRSSTMHKSIAQRQAMSARSTSTRSTATRIHDPSA